MVCYYGSHYAAYARTDVAPEGSYLPSTCVARCCLVTTAQTR